MAFKSGLKLGENPGVIECYETVRFIRDFDQDKYLAWGCAERNSGCVLGDVIYHDSGMIGFTQNKDTSLFISIRTLEEVTEFMKQVADWKLGLTQ